MELLTCYGVFFSIHFPLKFVWLTDLTFSCWLFHNVPVFEEDVHRHRMNFPTRVHVPNHFPYPKVAQPIGTFSEMFHLFFGFNFNFAISADSLSFFSNRINTYNQIHSIDFTQHPTDRTITRTHKNSEWFKMTKKSQTQSRSRRN